MKESHFDWIGLIPEGWRFKRLGHMTELVTDGTHRTPTYVDEGVPFLSIKDISGGRLDFSDAKFITEEEHHELHKRAPIRRGDILFTRIGTLGTFVEVDTDTVFDIFVSVGMLRLKESENADRHYLLHYLNSPAVSNYIQSIKAGFGTAAPKYNLGDVKKTPVLLPPIDEQHRIAAYLDNRCESIDHVAENLGQQIEMLEQYERSVIAEAVTKGINPNVEMKSSGINYVGDIPAHWCSHPVYYYFGERKNKNSLGQETNLLSLSYGHVVRRDINANGGLLPESFNTYNIIEAGDIIIRPTDLQNDKRSLRTGLATERGIITSAYIAMMPVKPINTAYYHYLLHAFDVMKVFYNMGNGVRQGLNFSEFSRLMVFEPPVGEQDEIVAYLDSKCSEIEKAIAEKREQLEVLAQYKKSLIYEYVTGKKEVPA